MNNTLLRIEKFAQKRPEAELVYALAELSWIEGRRLDRWRKPQALDRYLDAAAYSYDFLFETNPVLAEGRGPSDPRYRQAMEIYNAGLDQLIRAARTKGQIQPQNGEEIPFKFHGREREAPVRPGQIPLDQLRRPQAPPGLGFRGQRPQQGFQSVRPGRTTHRRARNLGQARRSHAAGAVLSGRDGLSPDGFPRPELAASRTPTSTSRRRGSAPLLLFDPVQDSGLRPSKIRTGWPSRPT